MSLHDAREDLRDLLNRDYKKKTALDFVCNHYSISKEDRNILARTSYSDSVSKETKQKELKSVSLTDNVLLLDTYNVIITLESVFFDDPLVCDDGIIRDGKGIFGKYEISDNTTIILEKIKEYIEKARPSRAIFFIDRQVSKSGELASMIRDQEWNVDIETRLSDSTDHDIKREKGIVATADYGIIKYVDHFVDIPKYFLFSW